MGPEDWSPCAVLYQNTVASPGLGLVAQAPPILGIETRCPGGLQIGEDLTGLGCEIKAQAPGKKQKENERSLSAG